MKNSRTFLLILLFGCANGLLAQAPQITLESPYNTVYVHLYYLQANSYRPDLAGRVFHSARDTAEAEELAILLKQVLDGKALFVALDNIPRTPDYLDSATQKAVYKLFPKELPEVYMERVNGRWYYSAQTAAALSRLHKAVYPFGTDLLLKYIPLGSERQVLGLSAWQWVGLLLAGFMGWLSYWLLSRLLRPLVRLLVRSKYSRPVEDKNRIFRAARLASLALVFWGVFILLPALQLPVKLMVFLYRGIEIGIILLITLLLLSIFNIAMQYAARLAETTERKLDNQLMPILRRMGQVVVISAGAIYILSVMQVNVAALIAGISIGGLALALAAQDTVKNLIGSAMIFFDKPFQIGDFILMSGLEGEVVEVGFRSTRIRTVDSSIVSVPNNDVATAAITNMGVRPYRMMKATLGVTYDTPPELLEKFIEGLRALVEAHPLARKDNYLVFFHSFGDSSLNIYFRTHIAVDTFAAELSEREKLSFGILSLANRLGIRFAFPTSTLFVEEFPGSGSATPAYDTDPARMDEKVRQQLETWKGQFLKDNSADGTV